MTDEPWLRNSPLRWVSAPNLDLIQLKKHASVVRHRRCGIGSDAEPDRSTVFSGSKSDTSMTTRLASLFLVLVLAGSTLAGVPIHFGESNCTMSGMMDMDCCEAALTQQISREVANAKLCCALNCAQNGTTSPPKSIRVTPSIPSLAVHPAIIYSPPTRSLRRHVIQRLHGPPRSGPLYLHNLALLI